MVKARSMGVVILPDAMFPGIRQQFADLAIKNRLPTVFARGEHVDAGGLISYGPRLDEYFVRAAGYVDRILKGAKPAELPVEQPTKVELTVNLKTAKALGIKFSQQFLQRADKVIE